MVRFGDTGGGEVLPQPLVGDGRQEHRNRLVECPPRPPDLLVVGDRRRRRAEMDAEREIGFVVAHAERGRRDQRLDLVAPQPSLQLLALGRLHLRRVGGDVEPAAAQQTGDSLGLGHGQHVDDARAGQLIQRVGDPRAPLHRVEPRDHDEPQRGAGERSPQSEGVRPELAGDVEGDPFVGGRGRRQHRRPGSQCQQRSGQPLVVRPEVEAPIGDAVRLVDNEQPTGAEQRRQLRCEPRVGQPLR